MKEWKILKRLWKELHSYRRLFALAFVLYLPLTFLSLAEPFLIGYTVDIAILPHLSGELTKWVVVFLLAIALHGLLEYVQLITLQRVGQYLVTELRTQLFKVLQELPISYFDKTPLGRILTRVTNDVEAVSELFLSGSIQVLGDILFLLGTLVMLLCVDIHLSAASLSTLPLLVLGLLFFRRWTRNALVWVRNSIGQLNSILQEYLSGMRTLHFFAQVTRGIEKVKIVNDEFMKANKKSILLDAAVYSYVDAFNYLVIALVLIIGLGLRKTGALELGVMVVFIEALNRFFQPIRELSNRFATIQNAIVAAERIFELSDELEVLKKLPVSVSKEAVFQRDIVFRNVTFSYRASVPILQSINLRLEKGEQLAVVGHTGAGKSTLIKLLMRLYEPQSGQILIDGADARNFSIESVRSLYNVVPQEVFLFRGTLRENLAYGKKSLSDGVLLKALESCRAAYLLERGGLDQLVEAKGQNLSLGERQLIALVRALVVNPPILLMDEATAGIDPHTERLLQIAIKQLLKERTALIVAHRLSTIQDCHRIVVFHMGHLVEEGTHEALLRKEGYYAKLIRLQNQAESR